MKKFQVAYKVGRFPQKTRRLFTTAQGLPSDNITAVCFDEKGRLYAGTDKGLARLDGEKFVSVQTGTKGAQINALCFDGGKLYVGAGKRLVLLDGRKKAVLQEFSSNVVDIKTSDSALWVLTETVFYKIVDGETEIKMGVPGKGTAITLYKNGRVYIATTGGGIHALVGKRWHWSSLEADSTGLISDNVNALYADPAGGIWCGTDKGVCVYDDNSLWLDSSKVSALPSLPVNGIVCCENGERWFASDFGLINQHNGALSYYGYKRWVPDPCVKAVAVYGESVCAATSKGLSLIETKWMTLEEKAKYLRKLTETYNIRKDGFVLDRELDTEGVVSLDEGYIPNTDNDGLRTAVYVADLAFEYACTGDKKVRAAAKRSLLALIKLTEITGVEGFSARAVRYPDERDYGTGARHEWHITKDKNGNEIEWLGETSSDEMVGHFYAYANYYDLVADDKEKALVSSTVTKILDHILTNNFRLVDTDGVPTTWANWNPELLNNDNKWHEEKGTNSLQILTFLTVGYHMTGNEKYKKVFDTLIKDKHYALNLMQYCIPDGHINHIDDGHDFLMISLLMKYTQDKELRSIFAMGLNHHWQYERAERNAFYNFVYGALTGERFDAENAIDELMEYPLDQVSWSLYNSYRTDLDWDMRPAELGMEPQLYEPLAAHERRITTNDLNRFICDSGAQDVAQPLFVKSDDPTAFNVLPPTGNDKGLEFKSCVNFTHPYWYARYYGLIEEEK